MLFVIYAILILIHYYPIEAVHRYYESRRRLFNDSKPERRESAAKTKSEQRKKDRRKRVSQLVYIV